MELTLGDVDGFDIRRLLALPGRPGVIAVNATGSEDDVVRALDLGADDCVNKPYGDRELLLRAHAVVRRTRGRRTSGGREPFGLLRLDSQLQCVAVDGRLVHLSPKELTLLQCLVAARGRLLTRKQLFAQVWEGSPPSEMKTLDVHVRRLRRKIEADPHEPRLLLTVRGRGYRLADERLSRSGR